MRLTHVLNSIYNSALALVYPQACSICGGSVEERRFGFVCGDCWTATRRFQEVELICWKCGSRSVARGSLRCYRCDESLGFLHSCGVYEKALRLAVLSLKREPFIPQYLIELLLQASAQISPSRCTRIVPVPLHEQRLKIRGFNQAEILATQLSLAYSLPLDTVSLIRMIHTERHRAGMDAKARRQTVAGAFVVKHPKLIRGQTILLVDDVFTSGATSIACAKVLLEAGAKDVFLLTVARTGSK
jgi:ComF family protein